MCGFTIIVLPTCLFFNIFFLKMHFVQTVTEDAWKKRNWMGADSHWTSPGLPNIDNKYFFKKVILLCVVLCLLLERDEKKNKRKEDFTSDGTLSTLDNVFQFRKILFYTVNFF